MSKSLRSYPEAQRTAVATKRVDTRINPQGTVHMPNNVVGHGLGTLSAMALLGSKVSVDVSDRLVEIGRITKVSTAKAARMMADAMLAEEG